MIVLIPSWNEAKSIGKTIADVKHYCDAQIVVVDSHSTDGTARIALNSGATVLDVPKLGKGRAIRDALELLHGDIDYFVMLDADYTYPAKHIPEIMSWLNQGYDVVMGHRKVRERGAMTVTNVFGNRCLSLMASLLYGQRVRDVCTGLWGFKASCLRGLPLTADGFTLEADLFACAVKYGFKVVEIPITYRARQDKPKLKVRDGFGIGACLIKSRFTPAY